MYSPARDTAISPQLSVLRETTSLSMEVLVTMSYNIALSSPLIQLCLFSQAVHSSPHHFASKKINIRPLALA